MANMDNRGQPAAIPGPNPGRFQTSYNHGDRIEITAPTNSGVVKTRFSGFTHVNTKHDDGHAVLVARLSPPGKFKKVNWKLYDWNWQLVVRDPRKILFFELERETAIADDPNRYQQIDIWIDEKQLVKKMDEIVYLVDHDEGKIEIRIPH